MLRKSPLFIGATRPACVWGIPIKPFLGCMGFFLLLAFWFYIPLMLLALPTLFVMHKIAEEDDQKFRQLFLTFRVNFLGGKNKSHWGGVTSLAPCEYQDKLKTKLYKKQ